MPTNRATVTELSKQIDLLNQRIESVDNNITGLSHQIITKESYYFWCGIFVLSFCCVSFAAGLFIGSYYSVTPQAETTEITDTAITPAVKPNKTSELKKIVDKVSISDRQKLSECIEKAIESDADDSWELRENLNDNIIDAFNDPEEKIWIPFRQWIEKQKPADNYESAVKIYQTIQTGLQTQTSLRGNW
jgi:hypothetical protein